jgi:hypothetical protein
VPLTVAEHIEVPSSGTEVGLQETETEPIVDAGGAEETEILHVFELAPLVTVAE